MYSRRAVLGSIGAAIATTGVASAQSGAGSDAPDAGNWPRVKFDNGNTGYNPTGSAPRSVPEVQWTAGNGDLYGDRTEGPYVADGLVYDARQGNNDQVPGVQAYDAESGEEVWSVELTESPRALVVADGLLHVGTRLRLLKFDAETGERRGERQTTGEAISTSPAVVDGTLYAVSYHDEHAIAIDAESYDRLWQSDELGSYVGRAPPAVVDGSVYVATNRAVVELDASDGTERREFDADRGSTPVVSDGVLYVSDRGSLAAYDLESGDRLWRYESEERSEYDPTAPVVGDGRVYLSDTGTTPPIVALDATDGSVEWRFKDDSICGSRDWGPGFARVGDLLVAANSMGMFYGIDPTSGERRWRYDPVDPWSRYTLRDFAVTDGVIYAQFSGYHGASDEIWAIAEPESSE